MKKPGPKRKAPKRRNLEAQALEDPMYRPKVERDQRRKPVNHKARWDIDHDEDWE
jgi:hypothetical protein